MTDFKNQAKELVAKMTLEEKMSQMRFNSPAIERLGIPGHNYWNEGLHGVARSGVATVFPQAIAMAASFDTDLIITDEEPTGDLGYPASAELSDGSILTVYYTRDSKTSASVIKQIIWRIEE